MFDTVFVSFFVEDDALVAADVVGVGVGVGDEIGGVVVVVKADADSDGLDGAVR